MERERKSSCMKESCYKVKTCVERGKRGAAKVRGGWGQRVC
jgi:hypothetical protein